MSQGTQDQPTRCRPAPSSNSETAPAAGPCRPPTVLEQARLGRTARGWISRTGLMLGGILGSRPRPSAKGSRSQSPPLLGCTQRPARAPSGGIPHSLGPRESAQSRRGKRGIPCHLGRAGRGGPCRSPTHHPRQMGPTLLRRRGCCSKPWPPW